MRLYNSQSLRVEDLEVLDNHIGIYVCGVTPYDTTHLGHAFTFLTFDILVRYLRHQGIDVTYVQNVTDIDDDILRKSKELGTTWDQLGQSEIAKFRKDMRDLNALEFDHYTAATDHIPQMQKLIASLIERGHAYESNGSVYFSVATDPEFGKVSHLKPEEWLPIANERGNFPDDPNKRDPIDFILWQATQPGEPYWESPWGPGRPGWHIECSAMSMEYLGNTVDIHGGGYDLLFPHHECETAQSELATGHVPFTRYWMHVAMVDYIGNKMSKSLGNLVLARDMIENYGANALRLCLFSNHYRNPWEFTDQCIQKWVPVASDILEAIETSSTGAGTTLDVTVQRDKFFAAMDNDLDTPTAIRQIVEITSKILQAPEEDDLRAAQRTLRELVEIIGLRTGAA
jgi:L-cysteine:1D-myo-inositol 2-amino-2-deoxy-alpha-D-glucopyranoside ligase